MSNQLIIFGSLIAGVLLAFVIPYQLKILNNSILITKKSEWIGQMDTTYLIDAGIAAVLVFLSDFLFQYSLLPEPQAYLLAFASGFLGFDIVKWSHKAFNELK